MEIVPIFANRLYAFNYQSEGAGLDEFERLFDIWQDVEYLEEFFESNQNDLQSGFFDPVPTVEQAVSITREEAKRFETHLRRLAQTDDQPLDAIFKPLSEHEDNFSFPRHKAYGLRYTSWLRIYAIKIAHRYYVTGGAIKLTKGMKERPHTHDELRKLQRCLSYFQEQGITDIDGARELDI